LFVSLSTNVHLLQESRVLYAKPFVLASSFIFAPTILSSYLFPPDPKNQSRFEYVIFIVFIYYIVEYFLWTIVNDLTHRGFLLALTFKILISDMQKTILFDLKYIFSLCVQRGR